MRGWFVNFQSVYWRGGGEEGGLTRFFFFAGGGFLSEGGFGQRGIFAGGGFWPKGGFGRRGLCPEGGFVLLPFQQPQFELCVYRHVFQKGIQHITNIIDFIHIHFCVWEVSGMSAETLSSLCV